MGKSDIKRVLGSVRRADDRFGMITDGDRIAVGVSGGKDSLLLLFALSVYRKFSKKQFSLDAVTVALGLEPFDTAGVQAFSEKLGVPFHRIDSDIAHVVFDVRREKNPCALCANMRRGAVNAAAKELGCNKVALAHHRDDAVETLLMSLFFEGRMHTFQPVTYLSRQDLTVIRPFVFVPEDIIRSAGANLQLPIVENPCPADGKTSRQDIKDLLQSLEERFPQLRERLLHALDDTAQYGLWDKSEKKY